MPKEQRKPDDLPQLYVVSEITEHTCVLTSSYHELQCQLDVLSWGSCVSVQSAKRLRRFKPTFALEVDGYFCISDTIQDGGLIITDLMGVKYV